MKDIFHNIFNPSLTFCYSMCKTILKLLYLKNKQSACVDKENNGFKFEIINLLSSLRNAWYIKMLMFSCRINDIVTLNKRNNLEYSSEQLSNDEKHAYDTY